ncbi:MAG: prolyl oligopeptidase family serine peptidase [Planctomycetia bacterium]|nr:prolyl oligopeptidase family serine peptidase [Planctomycetia bacterium]
MRRVVVPLLLALAVPACTRTRPAAGPVPDRAPPADVIARYARPGPVPPARVEVVARRPRLETCDVTLPARFAPDAPPEARAPISMRWWRPVPADAPRPAIVMSPILGGEALLVSDLALDLASDGYHVLVVRRGELRVDPARGIEQVEDRLAADVSGQVQALDWLLTHPDVDAARVASFGISAGGIQVAMVAGADPRYRAHVIALAGGPLPDVLTTSSEKQLRRLVASGRAQTGLTTDELREALRRAIVTDPVALARHVPPERVLLILADHDTSVPTWTGEQLREALGRPETVVLPWGHYGSILALPLVRQRMRAFLDHHLGRPAPL